MDSLHVTISANEHLLNHLINLNEGSHAWSLYPGANLAARSAEDTHSSREDKSSEEAPGGHHSLTDPSRSPMQRQPSHSVLGT